MSLPSTPRHFPAAPWPPALKVSSALGSLAIPPLTYAAHRSMGPLPGFAHDFGLVVVAILPAILVFSLLFMVRGYAVDGRALRVERLLWSTTMPLAGLRGFAEDPEAIRGARRVFGNAGLFSYTGLYTHRTLGLMRLFATDLEKSVLLSIGKRTVVVTPAHPDVLVAHLRRLFPSVHEGPA